MQEGSRVNVGQAPSSLSVFSSILPATLHWWKNLIMFSYNRFSGFH